METDLSALLPADVLADVLCRLAPRGLAAPRCVCKAWQIIIDARRLLRAELLPHSLAGIYVNFRALHISEFFSRPSKDPSISGKHAFLAQYCSSSARRCIQDHCNGLLLLFDHVLNPATRYGALPCLGTRFQSWGGIPSKECDLSMILPSIRIIMRFS